MYIVSIIIFSLSSLIHLYASYKRNIIVRNITKVFIVPSLMSIYYIKSPNMEYVFLIALLFSWLGDLLLILQGKTYFTLGGISFIISHLFFIFTYLNHISDIKENIVVVIIASVIYFIITSFIFKHLSKYLPKGLIIPMYGYLLINAAMNCVALSLLLANKSLASLVVFLGALFFYISDSNLFFVRFKKEYKEQNHFIVMFTYIMAELLIVIGIINI